LGGEMEDIRIGDQIISALKNGSTLLLPYCDFCPKERKYNSDNYKIYSTYGKIREAIDSLMEKGLIDGIIIESSRNNGYCGYEHKNIIIFPRI
jgi:hypothetical protein